MGVVVNAERLQVRSGVVVSAVRSGIGGGVGECSEVAGGGVGVVVNAVVPVRPTKQSHHPMPSHP